MIQTAREELKRFINSSYWLPASLVALATVIVVGVAIALADHGSGSADNETRCRSKAEAIMRQIIDDAKSGGGSVTEKPIPECLKVSPEMRAKILSDIIKKYGPEWSDAVTKPIGKS